MNSIFSQSSDLYHPPLLSPLSQPLSLKLSFSKAADTKKVMKFYESKASHDPCNFIKPRCPIEMQTAIHDGRATFLEDENETLHAAGLTYLHPAYEETGSLLCNIRGFGLSQLIILAQSFNRAAPDRPLVAKVNPSNKAMIGIFSEKLRWDRTPPIEDPHSQRSWFVCGPRARDRQAEFLNEINREGVLRNRDGREIPINIATVLQPIELAA